MIKPELNEEQLKIVESTKPQVVVVSCAATGKTRTLTARLQHLIDKGVDPHKIVAITFTNNAAAEIESRLTNSEGIFIGTIHSYCNYLLRRNGTNTTTYIENEQFDKLFRVLKNLPRADIEEVEHLLLDEAQDSNKEQFDFILKMVKPKNWMFFGDWNQSIYEFNGAEPKALMRLAKKPDTTVYHLTKNYRNGTAILDFAKTFLTPLDADFYDNSECASSRSGSVITSKLQLKQSVDYAVSQMTPETYKDWFILCRYNNQIDQVAALLANYEIPFVNFRQADLTYSQLQAALNSNCVKVLTIHSAKGLEAENVLVESCWRGAPEELRIKYVAATRAKNLLIWNNVAAKRKRKRK